ncbi:MAG TPA: lytic transglycosylase domain-containing protein [Aliiroseovarius sp.]|nr:lytic transglycosylase domain-containing protein [Aliiroseovarius sp.]
MKRRFVAGLTAAILCCAAPALADGAGRYPDFAPKFMKPPARGAPPPPLVQVDPEAQRRRMAALPKPSGNAREKGEVAANAPGIAKPDKMDWFWQAVSPALSDPGPERFQRALEQLAKAPPGKAVPSPRLGVLKEIAMNHGAEILKTTAGKRVSPALVLAVIAVESAGRSEALSSAGAEGLMQLIPDTAARFGVSDATDAAQNIKGGVAYLDWLMGEFGGDPVMVLAAYNAGENAVRKSGGVPPFAETRAYVPKVLAAWKVARQLCRTPPELVSDGCVFTVMGSSPDG